MDRLLQCAGVHPLRCLHRSACEMFWKYFCSSSFPVAWWTMRSSFYIQSVFMFRWFEQWTKLSLLYTCRTAGCNGMGVHLCAVGPVCFRYVASTLLCGLLPNGCSAIIIHAVCWRYWQYLRIMSLMHGSTEQELRYATVFLHDYVGNDGYGWRLRRHKPA